jgi:hypothetical protein
MNVYDMLVMAAARSAARDLRQWNFRLYSGFVAASPTAKRPFAQTFSSCKQPRSVLITES